MHNCITFFKCNKNTKEGTFFTKGIEKKAFTYYNKLITIAYYNNYIFQEENKLLSYFLDEAASTPAAASGWTTIIMLVAVIAVFYFMVMRPQKKQDREIQQMRDGLQVGDEITTIGGIIGKIISIKEETVMIETGKDRTRIRILKSAVRNVDVKAEDTVDAQK